MNRVVLGWEGRLWACCGELLACRPIPVSGPGDVAALRFLAERRMLMLILKLQSYEDDI